MECTYTSCAVIILDVCTLLSTVRHALCGRLLCTEQVYELDGWLVLLTWTFIHIIHVVVHVEVSVVHWPPCITRHVLISITVFSQLYIPYCCTKNIILQISAPKTQQLSTDVSILLITNNFKMLLGYTVAQLVEALRCRFCSWWGHWDVSLTWFILLHYGPEVYSSFSRNEYQGYLLGWSGGGG